MVAGGYWKHVSLVFSGAVVAQLIPIIGTLFIARIYTPADYGVYSVWLALVLILAVMLTLRYEAAFALEKDGEERVVAVFATLITIIIIGFFISVVLIIFNFIFPKPLQQLSHLAVLMLIPASVFLAFNIVLQSWAAADGRYHQLNVLRLVFAGSVTILQIIAGLVVASELTLLLMHTFGLFLSFCFAIYLNPIRINSTISIRLSIVSFWKRRKRFPVYSLPADLISTITAQLPLMIVTTRFGSEVGGILALTMRILGAPLGLLGKAVLDVFKRHASIEVYQTGGCRKIYLKTFKVLCLGSLIFIIGVILFADWFFMLAFGNEWKEAGVYAVWLLPLFAVRFIASPLSYTIYIVEKQYVDFLWQVCLLFFTVTTLLLPFVLSWTLLVYSFVCSLMYVLYLLVTYRLS